VLLQKDIDRAIVLKANFIVTVNLAKMVDLVDTSVSNRSEWIWVRSLNIRYRNT
jgi:hypothetical protein